MRGGFTEFALIAWPKIHERNLRDIFCIQCCPPSPRLPKKKRAPPHGCVRGRADPAATYSPGPEGRVPSAASGLTSVFGMGTGVAQRLSLPERMSSVKDMGNEPGRGRHTPRRRRTAPGAPRARWEGDMDKASRAISPARLNASRRSHLPAIYVVVYDGPSGGSSPRET